MITWCTQIDCCSESKLVLFLFTQGLFTFPYHINLLICTPTLGSIQTIKHPFSVSPSIYRVIADSSELKMDSTPCSRPVSFQTTLQTYSIMNLGDNVKLTIHLTALFIKRIFWISMPDIEYKAINVKSWREKYFIWEGETCLIQKHIKDRFALFSHYYSYILI